MKRKRILTIGMLLALAVFCAGCGDNGEIGLKESDTQSTMEGLSELNQNTKNQERTTEGSSEQE